MNIQQFEQELVNKLQFKSNSRIGIENVLLKIFKFFDLTNEGFLKRQDFFKAIAKSGVTIAEQEDADRLWNEYSQNETVNYKNFIQRVMSKNTPPEETDLGQYQAQYDTKIQHLTSQIMTNPQPAVIEQLKAKLILKGALGLLILARSLPNQFNLPQLQELLKKNQIEQDNLYTLFQGEFMGVSHFLNQIKGPFINQFRQTLLSNIYYSLEQTPYGVLPQTLVNRYRAERHPDIKFQNKSPDEIREEFMTGLHYFSQLKNIKTFSLSDFYELYSYLGFYIQNDELFRGIISSTWDQDQTQQNSPQQNYQIQQSPESVKSKALSQYQTQQYQTQQYQQPPLSVKQDEDKQSRQSVPRSQKSQQSQLSQNTKNVELIVQRIRNRLVSRGARGFISLYRLAKIMDADHDGLLNLSEFRRTIRDHKIEVTDVEIDQVFNYFDRELTGLIDVWGFMYVLRGEMSEQRQFLVQQVFEKFRNGDFVSIAVLKNNFVVRNHPELKSGKKLDDDIISDFFEPLVILHNINGGFGNENIPKEELFEFFSNYSAAIPDDKYFEQIVTQIFRLNHEQPKQHHAGGKQAFDPDHKKGYLQDHHRYVIAGGSVSANAPFGTFNQDEKSQRPSTAYVQPNSFNIFKPLQDDQKSNKLSESHITQQPQVIPQTPNQQVHYPIEQTPKQRKMDHVQILKNKILTRGLRGLIGIQARFQLYDRQNLGTLSYQEWLSSFKNWRLDVQESVLQEVFNQFQANGMIVYDAFVKQLQGTMTLRKFNIVQQAFELQRQLTLDQLRQSYNAKDHPEVRNNRRREDDILTEFLDTIEQHHLIFTGSDYIRNPNISFEEFISYHNNISVVIEDEVQFEQLVQSVWGVKRR